MLHDLRQVQLRHANHKLSSQLLHIHSEVTELYENLRALNLVEAETPLRRNQLKEDERKKALIENWDIIYSAFTSMFLQNATDEEIMQGMEDCLIKIQKRVGINRLPQ